MDAILFNLLSSIGVTGAATFDTFVFGSMLVAGALILINYLSELMD